MERTTCDEKHHGQTGLNVPVKHQAPSVQHKEVPLLDPANSDGSAPECADYDPFEPDHHTMVCLHEQKILSLHRLTIARPRRPLKSSCL